MGLVMCCYITGFQQKSIRTSKKSRDMAPWEASCLLTNGFLLYFCSDGHGTGVNEIHPETVIAGLTRNLLNERVTSFRT